MNRQCWLFLAALAWVTAGLGCDGDLTMKAPIDRVRPATITDLSCSFDGVLRTVTLTWTAPGDDGYVGRASSYLLFFATDSREIRSWYRGIMIGNFPAEAPANTMQVVTLNGVDKLNSWNDSLLFVVRTEDDYGNSSGSNICGVYRSAVPPPTDTIPDPIDDLSVESDYENRATLRWSAPTDNPVRYEIRYHSDPAVLLGWDNATVANQSMIPLGPGQQESHTVDNLLVCGHVHFGIRYVDTAGYWSVVSNIESSFPGPYSMAIAWLSDVSAPYGIAIDRNRSVYITEPNANEVRRFYASGRLALTWGSPGNADGQFNMPQGITVNGNGPVYVADRLNSRIQVFERNGRFLRKWDLPQGPVNPAEPIGVAVHNNAFVYVSDVANGQVLKFTPDGTLLLGWGSFGLGDGQFVEIRGVATDALGQVYVVDSALQRVQKFSADGEFLMAFPNPAAGSVSSPTAIAIDVTGNVHLSGTTSDGKPLLKYTSDGAFVTAWGNNPPCSWGISDVTGVAVTLTGRVYVVSSGKYKVIEFAPTGP